MVNSRPAQATRGVQQEHGTTQENLVSKPAKEQNTQTKEDVFLHGLCLKPRPLCSKEAEIPWSLPGTLLSPGRLGYGRVAVSFLSQNIFQLFQLILLVLNFKYHCFPFLGIIMKDDVDLAFQYKYPNLYLFTIFDIGDISMW